MNVTIGQLAERLGVELAGQAGDCDKPITAIFPIEAACETDMTFVTDDKHKAALGRLRGGAILVSTRLEGLIKPQLIVSKVNGAYLEGINDSPALPNLRST